MYTLDPSYLLLHSIQPEATNYGSEAWTECQKDI